MTNKDKVIAAFLVSIGMFTAKCAAEYVGTLSPRQKTAFINLADGKNNMIVAVDRSPQPVEGNSGNKG